MINFLFGNFNFFLYLCTLVINYNHFSIAMFGLGFHAYQATLRFPII